MKKTAQHKKIKVAKKEGFFESPLFLGLVNLLPIILVVLGVFYLGRNLSISMKDEVKVLGAESQTRSALVVRVEDRLQQLRDVANTTESERINEEIKRLESL